MNDAPTEATRGDYLVSTDPSRLDLTAVHAYLSRSYWSPGIPLEIVGRAMHGSLCFGVYQGERR